MDIPLSAVPPVYGWDNSCCCCKGNNAPLKIVHQDITETIPLGEAILSPDAHQFLSVPILCSNRKAFRSVSLGVARPAPPSAQSPAGFVHATSWGPGPPANWPQGGCPRWHRRGWPPPARCPRWKGETPAVRGSG